MNKVEDCIGNFYKAYANMRPLFKTLRHAKRYLNGIQSTFPSIKDEINYYDFFIIEAIRVFYPKLYDDIWESQWFYTHVDWDNFVNLSYNPLSGIEWEQKKKIIKDHVEQMLFSVSKSKAEQEILLDRLREIFLMVREAYDAREWKWSQDSINHYRKGMNISHPECFRKYFMLKIPSADISDNYIKTLLKVWAVTSKEELQNKIEGCLIEFLKANKLLKFLEKLSLFIEDIQPEVVLPLVKVISNNANKFRIKTENMLSSELKWAMDFILKIVNAKLNQEDIRNILSEIILHTSYWLFAVWIISFIRESQNSYLNIRNSIDIELLQNELSQKLKKHFVDAKKDIFNEFQNDEILEIVLRLWGSNWYTFSGENPKVVNEYITSLVQNDAKKFTRLLGVHKQEKLPFHEDLRKIYDMDKLRDIAYKFVGGKTLTPKEKELIEIFLEWVNKK